MGEGVADEVLGGLVLRQQGRAVGGQHQGHGVVEHRRPAIDLLLALGQGPVVQRRAGDLWRHDLVDRLGRLHLVDQGLHDLRGGAVADQDAELAAFQGAGRSSDDAQGRGGGQVVAHGNCGGRGPGQALQAQPARHHLGQLVVDIAQVGDHPFTDILPLAFAELEHQGVADMLLLDIGLADEELPRLAVVVAEAR